MSPNEKEVAPTIHSRRWVQSVIGAVLELSTRRIGGSISPFQDKHGDVRYGFR